ncbi:MAG: glycoside hydrolase family 3 C-terminal domain-containing protein [Eubacterium sp.]|nr:glycoside hydrolase family 3 C-terminal domain-containing protein [Eubacterium sp.]
MKKEFKEKAAEIVAKMTLEEAASQLRYDSPAIDRLGIPAFNWWSEGLHGFARAGTATVFPQAIALAAAFDKEMIRKIAEVVSTEARAIYNENKKHGDRDIYKGITIWSPNINIFRDPRWGRGQETYGEDPYLTGRLGVEFIKGLQGDGKYVKAAACAKHAAVHSGPEATRHSFDAVVSDKDLEETYISAFEEAVKEANVVGVMGAYNRLNGEPCCGSKSLLVDIFRKRFGFDGYIVSDCWAIRDFHENHMVTSGPTESAKMALDATCDLNCGIVYLHIMKAYEEGLITEQQIREAAERVYTVRASLGMFADDCEYDSIDYESVDTKESKDLAYQAGLKSVVMLKNDGILPLDKSKIKTIGIIGPTATSITVLNGNYNGTASEYVTNLDGIRAAAGDDIRILYSEGSHLYLNKVQPLAHDDDRIQEAVIVAEHSDVVILSLGLDSTIEGEEGDTGNAFAAGDKNSLYLPECQQRLLEAVSKTGKPIVVVINTGSAMDVTFADENCNAVLQAWYSGEYGGRALADILFGKVSPSGKLPVTFYKEGTLPDFSDYSMKGRTYKFMDSTPLYPFGFGLSYSSFSYGAPQFDDASNEVKVEVTNTGKVAADEIVEAYISSAEGAKHADQPKYCLCSFERVSLLPGETKTVTLKIMDKSFTIVTEDGKRITPGGEYTIYVGGQQPDKRSEELTGNAVQSVKIHK